MLHSPTDAAPQKLEMSLSFMLEWVRLAASEKLGECIDWLGRAFRQYWTYRLLHVKSLISFLFTSF